MLWLVLFNVAGKEGDDKIAQLISSPKIKESRFHHIVKNTLSTWEGEALVMMQQNSSMSSIFV